MERDQLIRAHDFCSNNKKALLNDTKCGCCYCLKIFSPKDIAEWLNEGDGTALCPYCGIDAVIGEYSKLPITRKFLKDMNEYWF